MKSVVDLAEVKMARWRDLKLKISKGDHREADQQEKAALEKHFFFIKMQSNTKHLYLAPMMRFEEGLKVRISHFEWLYECTYFKLKTLKFKVLRYSIDQLLT